MNKNLSTIDFVLFTSYILLLICFALWISRTKKGEQKNSNDYFLAGGNLRWWIIGGSLIASNISAEQFIGMSGSGYAIGLGIAAYEWIAAIALILVGKFFLPIFLKKGIYTMPQFLTERFDNRVSTSLAVFFLLIYIFVNLTSVSYLGALAIQTIFGIDKSLFIFIIILLFILASLFSVWGGLKAVVFTDIIQVVVLILGGLITTYVGLTTIAAKFGGTGFLDGLHTLYIQAPQKFDLILSPDNPQYKNLPGIAVLVGFMLLTNIGYWGLNQYIIQRGLAAKSIDEAQKGVLFAGYLKLLVPLIVVIPGIIAFVAGANISKPDEAYPWLLRNYIPQGIKGIALAALVSAIVSALASMINSTSTIFTLDIYKKFIRKSSTDKELVRVGRISGLIAIIIAVSVAPFLRNLDQAFQYIQEFTGFVYPGIIVIYFMGLFWKQATANAALWVAITCLPLSAFFKFMQPEMPFMDRMGFVFIILAFIGVIISLLERKGKIININFDKASSKRLAFQGYSLIFIGILLTVLNLVVFNLNALYVTSTLSVFLGIFLAGDAQGYLHDPKGIKIEGDWFKTTLVFKIASAGIVLILFLLYFFLY
jgi:solute:Na+ symporter, SSS family